MAMVGLLHLAGSSVDRPTAVDIHPWTSDSIVTAQRSLSQALEAVLMLLLSWKLPPPTIRDRK